MNWFSRTTSIAGMQVSNWILVIVASSYSGSSTQHSFTDEGAKALSSLNTFLPSYDLRTSSSTFATLAAMRRLASSRLSSSAGT
jgi:hypothetical protein